MTKQFVIGNTHLKPVEVGFLTPSIDEHSNYSFEWLNMKLLSRVLSANCIVLLLPNNLLHKIPCT